MGPGPERLRRVGERARRRIGARRAEVGGSEREPGVRLLLIGNYVLDEQQSMQRFARVLVEHLSDRGLAVEWIRPQPWCGRFGNPQAGWSKWLGYLDKFVVFPAVLQREIRRMTTASGGRLVVHICDHSNAAYTRKLRGIPHVVTCHDLLAVRCSLGEVVTQHPTRWTGRQLQGMILRGLERAGRATCISEATLKDLLRLSRIDPARADVTEMGLNYPYSPMPALDAQPLVAALLRRSQASCPSSVITLPSQPFPSPYLLHVGGNQWYKNRMGVLRIYSRLLSLDPGAPRLFMVGRAFTEEMRDYVARRGLQARVIPILTCGDEELRALYSLAELLLFPSWEEGFGWPIAEAQACGCRVVTTGKPPMTMVGGLGADYIDPSDPDRAAETVRRSLAESPSIREERRAYGLSYSRRFATSRMIDKYLEIYTELAA